MSRSFPFWETNWKKRKVGICFRKSLFFSSFCVFRCQKICWNLFAFFHYYLIYFCFIPPLFLGAIFTLCPESSFSYLVQVHILNYLLLKDISETIHNLLHKFQTIKAYLLIFVTANLLENIHLVIWCFEFLLDVFVTRFSITKLLSLLFFIEFFL